MISKQLLIALIIGATAMLVPIIVQAKWYNIKLWKCFSNGFFTTITGYNNSNQDKSTYITIKNIYERKTYKNISKYYHW